MSSAAVVIGALGVKTMFCSSVLIRRLTTTKQVEMFDIYQWRNACLKLF